jgi:hypothetical protein
MAMFSRDQAAPHGGLYSAGRPPAPPVTPRPEMAQPQMPRPQMPRPEMPEHLRPVLEQLLAGTTDDVACRQLHLSPRTFSRRVAELLECLEVRSRFQAGVEAVQRGLLYRTGPMQAPGPRGAMAGPDPGGQLRTPPAGMLRAVPDPARHRPGGGTPVRWPAPPRPGSWPVRS